MAKVRMVNTRFWNDGFISQLDPIEKLLFIYFLTNEHTNICGIYELPMKIAAIETGIDSTMFAKILPRLSEKIVYLDGWVCVKNFTKYQLSNPKVDKGIENELKAIPKDIFNKAIDYGYSIDRLSHLNLYLNLNSNLNALEDSRVSEEDEEEEIHYEDATQQRWGLNPKKVRSKAQKGNDTSIAVGFMWQATISKDCGIPVDEIPMQNIAHVVKRAMTRDKMNYDDFKALFSYWVKDDAIKNENKISFDLCLSEKYIAKWRLSRKRKNSNFTQVSMAEEIDL